MPPELQKVYRDAAAWMLMTDESRQKFGGTFKEFERLFRMVTPKEVLSQFLLLTKAEQMEFISSVAAWSTAEVALEFVNGMSEQQRASFFQSEIEAFRGFIIPTVLVSVIELVRKMPTALADQLYEEASRHSDAVITKSLETMNAFAFDQWKGRRDRKSKPSTIKRNVEVCDLRLSNKKLWTQGRLSKKFKITPQAIRKILSEETKWRQLAAELSTN